MHTRVSVFQRLPQRTVPEGLSQWPSPFRVHWPSLVVLSFLTIGRVMASPRPPHSAWLHCQHQASHAIKQLAPFINLTSAIYGGRVRVRWEREAKTKREGSLMEDMWIWRSVKWEGQTSVLILFAEYFCLLNAYSKWHFVCLNENILKHLHGNNHEWVPSNKTRVTIKDNWFLCQFKRTDKCATWQRWHTEHLWN